MIYIQIETIEGNFYYFIYPTPQAFEEDKRKGFIKGFSGQTIQIKNINKTTVPIKGNEYILIV